jgi:hypothetical protein
VDAEMVAVTAYDPNPITRSLSMTFYPGIRPLQAMQPASDVHVVPLFSSSRDSYTRMVEPAGVREAGGAQHTASGSQPSVPGPRLLAIAAEGQLAGAPANGPKFRAIVIGDGDFASNSFLPYLSNSDFAMSAIRWLVHEERSTAVASRIPVPPMILLSGAQMRAVFLLLEVLLPLAVIAMGIAVWWRRR